ncbi:MAG TPA: hypothetical protein ENI38_01795 [Candidatus Acetothermia bacterium]|nr:hypothetical protein [Candidatus Acetothermia bacterium]
MAGQAEKYLDLLGLADRGADPVGTLFEGMRQRLASSAFLGQVKRGRPEGAPEPSAFRPSYTQPRRRMASATRSTATA